MKKRKFDDDNDDYVYDFINVRLPNSKQEFNVLHTFINKDDILESLETSTKIFIDAIDDFNSKGSGFILHSFIQFNIHIASYTPLAGSSYLKLPSYYENKKACVNVQNKNNNDCFRYSVLASKYDVKIHPERESHYKTHQFFV